MMSRAWVACVALLFAGAVEGRERTAVFDLTPEQFDRAVAQTLSQRLRQEFRRMDHLELVERSDLYAFLVGKGLDMTACDRPCLDAVGRALGARWIVAGRIATAGDRVRIEAMLYDPQQERVSKHVDRKVSADVERLREREMERLARDLSPAKQGGGIPWLLLLLGAGGGGAWWAIQANGTGGSAEGGGTDGNGLGAAEVTGIIPE